MSDVRVRYRLGVSAHHVGALVVLMLSGCGRRDEARASVGYRGTAAIPPSAVTLTIDGPGTTATFHGAELPSQGTAVRTPEVATSVSGNMTIGFTLATPQGDLSRGSVTLPLRPDWNWGVDVVVDTVNPARLCLGCVGSKSFPLKVPRTPTDSVWMVWGGNSLSNPVVY